LQPAAGVVFGEPVDPFGGGEQDPVPGLAGADGDAGGEVGLTRAGRAEEHDVLLARDEVQGAQVGDDLALEPAGVVDVELLEALAGGELLVGPGLAAGAFGQPGDCLAQCRRLQRAGQERQLGGHVPPGGLRHGGHQVAPLSPMPNTAS